MPRRRAAAQQLLLLVVLLVSPAGTSGEDKQPTLQLDVQVGSDSTVACTVDDLVPPHDQDVSDMWDKETLVPPSFDCTCRTLKARCVCSCVCVLVFAVFFVS